MTQDTIVMIRFKDVEHDEETRDRLEERCRALAEEFPETVRYELALEQAPTSVTAHAHVTGKGLDAAAHATAADPQQAGKRALEKLERELRRLHDVKIFAHRRAAQRSTGKRT